MIKKLFVVLLLLNCSFAYAQTIKTDILVIGGEVEGTAAAIQAARSKLKTVLIEPGTQLCPSMAGLKADSVGPGGNLPSGIWMELRKHIIEFYKATKGADTTGLHFEPYTSTAILKKITDTVKNLTVKLNAPAQDIKKDGDGWVVTISQEGKSQAIKARVLIDATKNAMVAQKFSPGFKPYQFIENNQQLTMYRTGIATGYDYPGRLDGTTAPANSYPQLPAYSIPLNAIVAKGTSNLLVVGGWFDSGSLQYLPNRLALGQGAGATAAFCAFFKTTTKNLNVRVIQGELLDFKALLLPFADISGSDPYIRAIQQVGATGLLKGVQKQHGGHALACFMPDSTVNTAEIEPVLNDIYTRTFLWFNREKPGAKFTTGNLMSLISEITLTDPKNLQVNLSKAWKTQYKFTSDFDLARPVTRREFAILVNKFLKPFARTVDMAGRFVN